MPGPRGMRVILGRRTGPRAGQFGFLGDLVLRVHLINEGDRQPWPPRLPAILGQAGNLEALGRLSFSGSQWRRWWGGGPLAPNGPVHKGSGWPRAAPLLDSQRAPPTGTHTIRSRHQLGFMLLVPQGSPASFSLRRPHGLPPFRRGGPRGLALGDEHERVSRVHAKVGQGPGLKVLSGDGVHVGLGGWPYFEGVVGAGGRRDPLALAGSGTGRAESGQGQGCGWTGTGGPGAEGRVGRGLRHLHLWLPFTRPRRRARQAVGSASPGIGGRGPVGEWASACAAAQAPRMDSEGVAAGLVQEVAAPGSGARA